MSEAQKAMDDFMLADDRLGQMLHEARLRQAEQTGGFLKDKFDQLARIEAKVDKILAELQRRGCE